MNNTNLVPFNQMSAERHKELSRSGGVASGIARKEKATMKECLEKILFEITPPKEANKIFDSFNIKDKEYRSNAMAVSLAIIKQAMNGNVRAFEIIRDTVERKANTKN